MTKYHVDQLNIPITESDIEMFKRLVDHNETFTWTFETEDNEQLIEVNFIQERED
jgi:hypothetical protein